MMIRLRHILATSIQASIGMICPVIAIAAPALDLTTWTDRELVPYLESQLSEHPRFRGETVLFVAMDGGAPAPITNTLAIALRDRVVDAIAEKPGIRIGWQTSSAAVEHTDVDCTRDAVHYYIGFEISKLIDRRYRVTMRVLDAEDRSWVAGAGQSWEGRVTGAQRRAFEETRTDEYFRGTRDVPYAATQTDMLAKRLAHDLACNLMQQLTEEYVIAANLTITRATTTPTGVADTVELVRNNLAAYPTLNVSAQTSAANARLDGRAHRIVDDLYQYWVTVTPTGDAMLPSVSASAYVRLSLAPGGTAATTAIGPTHVPMPVSKANGGFLAPLRIVEPPRRRSCYGSAVAQWVPKPVSADHTIARGECFYLQSSVDRDVTVFLLNYQVHAGLVRLSGDHCGDSSNGIRVRAGDALHFPAAGDPRPAASAWQGQRGLESFYAIAATDADAVRELTAIVARLPARCSLSPEPGLSGTELESWFDSFGAVMDRWRSSVDWQAVRIRHVL